MNIISHMFFQNLHLSLVQNEIKQLCQGKSGVYRITNLKNKKSYIGSAITKKPTCNRLYFRFRNHFFNHHKELPLKRAIKKYGIKNFSWEILQFTELTNTRRTETNYIQTLKPEYNILQSAESSLGYIHTPLTRQKIKTEYTHSRRERLGN
jgi:group I intron endonuclease